MPRTSGAKPGGGGGIRTHERRKPLRVFKFVFIRPPVFVVVCFVRKMERFR